MSTKVSDLAIERLALGELAKGEAARVRAALGDEADAKLGALAREDAEILAQHPPAVVAAEVRRRLARVHEARRPAAIKWWIPAVALLATGALAWWWARLPQPMRDPGGTGDVPVRSDAPDASEQLPETLRVKGKPTMQVHRLVEGATQQLDDGDLAGKGDRLQVQYRAGDREEGAIVSIDGRGVATLHFPADVGASPLLRTGGMTPLDHSYELDDAPGFERFFLVTVEPGQRLHVDVVLDAARALAGSPFANRGELELPRGYEQLSLSLRKR